MRARTWLYGLWFLLVALPFLGDTAASNDAIQWKNIGPGNGGDLVSSGIHPGNPDIVLMGSDVGGIFRTADGGQTWQVVNNALVDPERYKRYGIYGHFAFDPSNPDIVYFGALRSSDAGATWNVFIDESSFEGTGGVIDPSDPNIVYAFGHGNVYRTTDGWQSTSCTGSSSGGTVCDPAGATCAPGSRCYQQSCIDPGTEGCTNYTDQVLGLAIDHAHPTSVLACAEQGLFLSEDSAVTWGPASAMASVGDPDPLPGEIHCARLFSHWDEGSGTQTLLMVLRTEPFVFGGVHGIQPPWVDIDSWEGGVYRSTDFGQTWESIHAGEDGENPIANADFENSFSGWNNDSGVTIDSSPPPGRSGNAVKIDATGTTLAGVTTSSLISISGGNLYKISAWYLVDGAGGASSTIYPAAAKVYYYTDEQGTGHAEWPGENTPKWHSVEPWNNTVKVGETLTFNGVWRRFETLIIPPKNATHAKLMFRASNGSGTTWIDDVSLRESHSLPRVSGRGDKPFMASYSDIVADPTDVNVIYVGNHRGTASDIWDFADTSGIWKTDDGGATWEHVTRRWRRDNVDNGASRVPVCGDQICGGKWEDCHTCPQDCIENGQACCGDGVLQAGEDADTCRADAPFEPDPNCPEDCEDVSYRITSAKQEVDSPYYSVGFKPWTIAIGNSEPPGSPILGHLTLYWGGEATKTTDGGATWQVVSSDLYTGPDSDPGTVQPRGEDNGVFDFSVVEIKDPQIGRDWLLYGDSDENLQVSYNGGKSFAWEGWQWEAAGVAGDSATSILLDESDPDSILVGVSSAAASWQYRPSVGGVASGTYVPGTGGAVGTWTWTAKGTNQGVLRQTGGGVDLARTEAGDLLASSWGNGVYKLVNDQWTRSTSWNPPPVGWKTYRMFPWPSSNPNCPERVYVGVGDPRAVVQCAADSGIWESIDGGTSWTRISDATTNPCCDETCDPCCDPSDPNCDPQCTPYCDPSCDPGAVVSMGREPVMDIARVDEDTMLVGTWFAYGARTTDTSGNWNGDGGIYQGVRTGDCQESNASQWTWSRVLAQPLVSGLAVSPASSDIVYAFAGQPGGMWPGQYAGIYKSVDGGVNWAVLANDGLANLSHGRLYISPSDPRRIYASTIGNGVFEGTITCGPPKEGFPDLPTDHSTGPGAISSGSSTDVNCDDSIRETLTENLAGGKARLTHVWKFENVPAGTQSLLIDGHRGVYDPNEAFRFYYNTTGTGFYLLIPGAEISLPVDTTQIVPMNLTTTTAGDLYIQVNDTMTTDTQKDLLYVDQLTIVTTP